MELLERTRRGDLDGVKTLIQQSVDVNMMNSREETALYYACQIGETEIVQYLLDNGAEANISAKPLIVAVKSWDYNCVKTMLEHQADVNCTNAGESPMSVALENGFYPVILLLLQYGAIPPASLSNIGRQLLREAKSEHAKIIEKLIEENVISLSTEMDIFQAFKYAFKNGCFELAAKMLSNDSYSKIEGLFCVASYYSAKHNWPTLLSKLFEKEVNMDETVDGETPLYVACKEGHEFIVDLLLNNGANPNVRNEVSPRRTPLRAAVKRRNTVIINKLLEKGAKFSSPGEPLLRIACGRFDSAHERNTDEASGVSGEQLLPVIKLLLEHGADVNAVSQEGDTALYCACRNQQLEVVQTLLEAGADVNLTNSRSYPLIAACNTGNAEIINMLLKSGVDLHCRGSNNETCTHAIINAHTSASGSQKPAESASRFHLVDMVSSFLEGGVDVNARCSQEETALYRASKAGLENIVQVLVDANAEVNGTSNRRPLYAACEHGHTLVVSLLLERGADCNYPTSASSRYQSTMLSWLGIGEALLPPIASSLPLCCAMKKGHSDIIHLLLQHGADVNKLDQAGKSAMTYIVELLTSGRNRATQESNTLSQDKDFNMFKCMLEAGCDVNLSSLRDGLTILHIASSFGMCDIMTELIVHGAHCNQMTTAGKTPLDLACENGHEAAAYLLLKNGAKPNKEPLFGYFYADARYGVMPILCTAAKSGSESMVKMLLEHGAHVNTTCKDGNTALHMATSSTMSELLLKAGANVNATNDNGETALSVVCSRKQPAEPSIVELLLKSGADPNIHSPLHAACEVNSVDIVQLLLLYGADVSTVEVSLTKRFFNLGDFWMSRVMPATDSPLCIACRKGNALIVECLLKNSANVAFADENEKTPLHFAVGRVEEEVNADEYDPIVTLLVQHGAPVNVVSAEGESPLYMACMKGLAGVAKQLLDCRADTDLTAIIVKKYPLLIACIRKFRNVAMLLVDRGANTNVTQDNQTPLKVAAANGDAVLVKKLLSHEADVNHLQNVSDTALHVAVIRSPDLCVDNFVSIVRRLLKSGGNVNALNGNGETPLYLACKPSSESEVNLDIVKSLLEHGADPNICPSIRAAWKWSCETPLPPLSAAASCGNTELVTLLLKFEAKVHHRTKSGRTGLHYAVGLDNLTRRVNSEENITSVAEMLLSAGAEVNAMDETRTCPLYLACSKGKTEFVKILLDHGADANAGRPDKYPLHAACRGRHLAAVKLLLEHNADVTLPDERDKTALHHVLESESGGIADIDTTNDLVQLLVDGGADMNVASEHLDSPLYVSCSKGLTTAVEKMLECGAKVDGIGGKLPLNAACRNKNISLVELLLSNGANPNAMEPKRQGSPCMQTLPLHVASVYGDTEVVELLLNHGATVVDIVDIDGNTALHHAVKNHSRRSVYVRTWRYSNEPCVTSHKKSVIDNLLEHGADVNIINSAGETPLFCAAYEQLEEVVSKMLQLPGTNPNRGSSDKQPLEVACEKRNVKLVEMLLNHGADPNLSSCDSNSNCKFPLCTAVKQGDCDEIVKSLLTAGANVNAMNCNGRSVVCVAIENVTGHGYYQSRQTMKKKLATVRLLLEDGADLNLLMPDGRTALNLVVSAIYEINASPSVKTSLGELLQLMVQYGAILEDSSNQLEKNDTNRQLEIGTLRAIATFDDSHEFIVDLLRAGAGFFLISLCCFAVLETRGSPQAKSIRLCQAVVLAGYVPTDEEILDIQAAATAADNDEGEVLQQLVNWVNEDRQEVSSLLRQCRVAIRRHLTAAVNFRSILPAVDSLPLPKDMKMYLKFEGTMCEVDLSLKKHPETSVRLKYVETSSDASSIDSEIVDSEIADYDYSDYDLYRYYYDRDDSSDDDRGWFFDTLF